MDKFEIVEDEDLYSGFNEFHPTLNTANLIQESLNRDILSQKMLMTQVRTSIETKTIPQLTHPCWLEASRLIQRYSNRHSYGKTTLSHKSLNKFL